MSKKIQTTEKIKNYLEEFIRSEHFLRSVAKIRKELKIPATGFEVDLSEIRNPFYIPEQINFRNMEEKLEFQKKLKVGVSQILKKVPFKSGSMYPRFAIKVFIFHNKLFFKELGTAWDLFKESNTIRITNAKTEFLEFAPDTDSFLAKNYIEMMRKEVNQYPVFLKISPEASGRDISNFVKSNLTRIEELLDQFSSGKSELKNRKTGKNKNQERDDSIYDLYKNKKLTIAEIRKALNNKKKYNELDSGTVGKIISIERKKRGKV